VTGGAGFIGSHIIETLLELNQKVVCLDNFETGKRSNLATLKSTLGEDLWSNFHLVEGDIREMADCLKACSGIDFVLHHAALGSVPLSIEKPELCHAVNVVGSENIFHAAKQSGVKRVIYASSSAVYGDEQSVPAIETRIGTALSPYAESKHANELSAAALADSEMAIVGLRYFNVVGPRQDPNGAYAAVIPRWIEQFKQGGEPSIFGNGETTRDFCPVQNVVQANLSSALCQLPSELNSPVCNVALGKATSLNELYYILRDHIASQQECSPDLQPSYAPEREGDVRHSCADISFAKHTIEFAPSLSLKLGLSQTVNWYLQQ